MPRVYLIFRNQLFSDAIAAILRTHPEIELVGVTDNPNQVPTDVLTLAPDVVLLEGADDEPVAHNVHAILSGRRPHRLITLRMDENGMHVWSQTWRQTVSTKHLVRAIISTGEVKS